MSGRFYHWCLRDTYVIHLYSKDVTKMTSHTCRQHYSMNTTLILSFIQTGFILQDDAFSSNAITGLT